MTSRKQNSTNQLNNQVLQQCSVSFTLDKISGRWKSLILYNLRLGTLRYGQLKKIIPLITEKMLAQQLRELEADNLVIRDEKSTVPLHVEYSLTEEGASMTPIFIAMSEWGEEKQPKF